MAKKTRVWVLRTVAGQTPILFNEDGELLEVADDFDLVKVQATPGHVRIKAWRTLMGDTVGNEIEFGGKHTTVDPALFDPYYTSEVVEGESHKRETKLHDEYSPRKFAIVVFHLMHPSKSGATLMFLIELDPNVHASKYDRKFITELRSHLMAVVKARFPEVIVKCTVEYVKYMVKSRKHLLGLEIYSYSYMEMGTVHHLVRNIKVKGLL